MMPQNAWLSADAPLSWGIYRNIPFAVATNIVMGFAVTGAVDAFGGGAAGWRMVCLLYTS